MYLFVIEREEIMMRFGLIQLVVCFSARILTMEVGIIDNAYLSTSCPHPTINASTCHECLCESWNMPQNILVLSLNCHIISSNEVNCELFTMVVYFNSCSFHMENNSNSTYCFQLMPPSSQSVTIATKIERSLTGKSPLPIKILEG